MGIGYLIYGFGSISKMSGASAVVVVAKLLLLHQVRLEDIVLSQMWHFYTKLELVAKQYLYSDIPCA
jgi:hypothetical protein